MEDRSGLTKSRPGLLSTFWVPAAQIWSPLNIDKKLSGNVTVFINNNIYAYKLITKCDNILISLGLPPVATNRLGGESHPAINWDLIQFDLIWFDQVLNESESAIRIGTQYIYRV